MADSPYRVPASAEYRLPPSSALLALLLGAWLVACDVWIKTLARWSQCSVFDDLTAAFEALATGGSNACAALSSGGVSFGVFERHEVLLFASLPDAYQRLWGLALLALASITTIVIARWQHHVASDALALATLWAGVLIHALPRLRGAGMTFAEVQLHGYSSGLADIYVAIAVFWIGSRALAEWRA